MRGKDIEHHRNRAAGTEAVMLVCFKEQATVDRTAVDCSSVHVSAANIPAVLAALQANRVTWCRSRGRSPAAQARGSGRTLISPARGDIPAMSHELHGVVYTRRTTIDRITRPIVGFVRGYADACTTSPQGIRPRAAICSSVYPNLRSQSARPHLEIYRATSVPASAARGGRFMRR